MRNVPKYYRISRGIISSIRAGTLRPGMRAPSENEIIKKHKVSNTTARKALQEIESAGWVTRIKGRGTFVCHSGVERSATRILGFTRNMTEAGRTPSTKLLEVRVTRNGYCAEVNGRRYSMKGPLCRIRRLRFADNVPMMLEVRYISLRLCPGIEERDFEGSLYDIYRSYGHQLTEINQVLSATTIDSGLKEFFGISEPISAFRVESVTFCGKELILEMEDSVYRGDKYRFSVRALPSSSDK